MPESSSWLVHEIGAAGVGEVPVFPAVPHDRVIESAKLVEEGARDAVDRFEFDVDAVVDAHAVRRVCRAAIEHIDGAIEQRRHDQHPQLLGSTVSGSRRTVVVWTPRPSGSTHSCVL